VDLEPEEYRARSRERWGGAAAGWERRRAAMQASAAVVSTWLVEHVEPQPGQTILELAAGPGDTGLMAAELVGPSGRLISSDASEEMIDVARRRAEELGIANAEFEVMEGEWIDLPTASVDAVLCRWGYMLMLDPEASLRETRRVLRPGGHVALAAWAAPEENPNMTLAPKTLLDLGLTEPPPAGEPGPFAFAQPGRIEELLDAAGFDDVLVEAVDLHFHFPTRDDVFETFLDLSPTGSETLRRLSPADHTRFRDALDERLEPFVRDDGGVELPGRTLVAAASA
jgi:SAM-dependent methyltransferase